MNTFVYARNMSELRTMIEVSFIPPMAYIRRIFFLESSLLLLWNKHRLFTRIRKQLFFECMTEVEAITQCEVIEQNGKVSQ